MILQKTVQVHRLNGEETIPDTAVDVEEQAIQSVMVECLHKVLTLLTEDERWLVDKLHFQGISQSDLEKESGISQQVRFLRFFRHSLLYFSIFDIKKMGIILEQIRTIDRLRFREYIGHLDLPVMEQVDLALAVSVGLSVTKAGINGGSGDVEGSGSE